MRRALGPTVPAAIVAFAGALVGPGVALAQPLAACTGEPRGAGGVGASRPIALEVHVDDATGVSEDALREHVSKEVGARGLSVCEAKDGAPPGIAVIQLGVARVEAGGVVATIAVRDASRTNDLERHMVLSRVPADVRPLAIATAADELLRASWADITGEPAPPSVAPRETPAATAPRATPPSSTSSLLDVGLALDGSRFSARRALGADLSTIAWMTSHVGAELRVHFDVGADEATALGSARADSFGGTAGLVVAASPEDARVGLAFDANVAADRLTFTASPGAGATGHDGALLAVLAGGGAHVWIRAERLRFLFGAALLVPLVPARANDATKIVTGLDGAGVLVRVGVAFSLLGGR